MLLDECAHECLQSYLPFLVFNVRFALEKKQFFNNAFFSSYIKLLNSIGIDLIEGVHKYYVREMFNDCLSQLFCQHINYLIQKKPNKLHSNLPMLIREN